MLKNAALNVQTKQKGQDPFQRLQVDIEAVLLNESNRPVQEVYAEARQRFEKPGCCLIVKFEFQGKVLSQDPLLKLGITMYLRSVLETCVISTNHDNANKRAKLIKYDDDRVFLFHEKASVALRSACQANLVAKYCHDKFWASHQVAISVTCGLEVGNLLLLVGDYYGDAVNVASKLGEDHAEAGQILISHPTHDAIAASDPTLLNRLAVEDGFVQISGVGIPYKSIKMAHVGVEYYFLAKTQMPSQEAVFSANAARRVFLDLLLTQQDGASEANCHRQRLQEQRQIVTMLQSDMSGFTRLTKKYGILHFLTLVTQCRKIFKQRLPPHQGSVVKYDGDNVICKFDSPTQCLAAVQDIHVAINDYNMGKEKDYQICIKLGVSHGEVLIAGHDIVGDSWEACCTLGEDAAKVGEVLVTCAVHDYLQSSSAHQGVIPRVSFESRQVELNHTETLRHYNVTFPDSKEKESSSSFVFKTPEDVSSFPVTLKSHGASTEVSKGSSQPAILPMLFDEMRFI